MPTKPEFSHFLQTIKDCRRRLNLASLLRYLTFALLIGGAAALLFQISAFIVPFYNVNLYCAAALVLAALSSLIPAYLKRCTMEKAALAMDRFGFEERIVTAYENRHKEEDFAVRQRADAVRCLTQNKDKIKIRLLPDKRQLAGLSCLLLLIFTCALLPSPVKQRAEELHKLRQAVKEKEQEIEEVIEQLEELAKEEISPEELETLQDMLDSLNSSLSEYEQAASGEELAAANERLDYKYSDMSSQLADMAQSLQNGATPSLSASQSAQDIAQQLQAMGSSGEGGKQTASNNGNNGQNGQNSGGSNGQNGQNGQNSNGENGQGSGGENGQSGQNGQNSGSNGQNGQGSGGENGQNGQGSGGENGQNGGQGNNGGENGGGGNGRGTGSMSIPHDYISVPNAIADNENLTGTPNGSQNSEFYRTQNGLAWKGRHVSYESVIGSYQRNAYEGIAAGRYPSGMEDIIKGYFSSFN